MVKKITLFILDQSTNVVAPQNRTFHADQQFTVNPPDIDSMQRFTNIIEKSLDVKWINWNCLMDWDNQLAPDRIIVQLEAQLSDMPFFNQGNIYDRVMYHLQYRDSATVAEGNNSTGHPIQKGNGRDTLFNVEKFRGLGVGEQGRGSVYLNVNLFTFQSGGTARQLRTDVVCDLYYE